jgi:hypothetical protein
MVVFVSICNSQPESIFNNKLKIKVPTHGYHDDLNAGQRGRLDCGGPRFVIIRYGNFYEYIRDYKNVHISICIEKNQNPVKFESALNKIIDPRIHNLFL